MPLAHPMDHPFSASGGLHIASPVVPVNRFEGAIFNERENLFPVTTARAGRQASSGRYFE
ncbi:hypothetical protein BX600DRAFT_465762 [Xylariales sp. PMI_506]|nr:hypothetical protein BX600DRAFT_465762 [Xylariales sp. PMI_506]